MTEELLDAMARSETQKICGLIPLLIVGGMESMFNTSNFVAAKISGEIQSPLGVARIEFIDPRERVAVIILMPLHYVLYKNLCCVQIYIAYKNSKNTILINCSFLAGCSHSESRSCSYRTCIIDLTNKQHIILSM